MNWQRHIRTGARNWRRNNDHGATAGLRRHLPISEPRATASELGHIGYNALSPTHFKEKRWNASSTN